MAVLQLQLSVVPLPSLLGVRLLMKTGSFVLFALGTIAVPAALFAACGGDTFIATNENLDDAGSGGSSAGQAGTGGSSGGGASGAPSTGGSAGGGPCTPGETIDLGSCERCGVSRRVCDENGQFGDPVCEEQGECEAGASETQDCGNCGSQQRTCSASCSWGDWSTCSQPANACAPGAVSGTGCDGCSQKTCGSNCQWSACQLKPGSQCEYEGGSNWQCCGAAGANRCQYCSSSCQWYPCQAGACSWCP